MDFGTFVAAQGSCEDSAPPCARSLSAACISQNRWGPAVFTAGTGGGEGLTVCPVPEAQADRAEDLLGAFDASALIALREGRHVLGQAKTGSGKTASFGLPVLHRVEKGVAMQVLILAPTRELAAQINESIRTYSRFMQCSTALVVGVGRAAREGVLLRDAETLETLAGVTHVVFDKTGTLTEGAFAVERVLPAEGVAEGQLLVFAAAVESQSEHPLARGVVAARGERGLPSLAATEVRAVPGAGARGRVAGKEVRVGSPDWLRGEGLEVPELELAAGETAIAAAPGAIANAVRAATGIRPRRFPLRPADFALA